MKGKETKKLTEKVTQETLDMVEEALSKQASVTPATPGAPAAPPVAGVLPPELRRGLQRPGRK